MTENSQPTPLLGIQHLSVEIHSEDGDRTVLHDVSLTLNRGEILALVGESGSGKSLTVQAVMGLLPHPAVRMSCGQILLDGQRIDNNPAALQAARGKRLAMIFQEPMAALNPVQTVGTQLAEVFSLHQPALDAGAITARCTALLERVGIDEPASRLRSYPHQLSGGQCQRVMIAMALACEPDILIADEPSTALDARTQHQILALLKDLQQQTGMAVIFITHDLALAAQWCQRIAVMQHGRVCEVANTETLFQSATHPYTQQLLAALRDAPFSAPSTEAKKALLSVRQLEKSFATPTALFGKHKPARKVLQDVSFEIGEGEVVALVGESGCGKSTLGRALLFLDPPDSGEIYFAGQHLNALDRPTLRQLRRSLQVIFQDTNESLNPRHTIGRILSEPFEIHGIGNSREREEKVRSLLQRVELSADSINRFPHEFSGGQRQRIGIARAIALNPKLLVCDEAVSALDVSTQAQIIDLLLSLKSELGLSLLFITHDLHVVRRIADRVLVMEAGKIVESNTVEALFSAPQHPATRALLAARPAIPASFGATR